MSLISAQTSSALKERLHEERIELSIYHAMFRLRDVRFTPKSGYHAGLAKSLTTTAAPVGESAAILFDMSADSH